MMNSRGSNATRLALPVGFVAVALAALLTAAPLEAKPGVWQGKSVNVSGVLGCDCTNQDAKECWCTIP